ncbi:MAG: 30S ribosome-binding factor RbfA [Proteobacteria bacterium]|jgi:ribosome-binding factor A|nr:30S ribosome-binding factor RbfA [Pseudomonadota bacterium]MCH8835646.1 30S ribosome-binding factor RbfA [Pseudomonadota bacterium]MCZ6467196.1 30S ribosome-binding factor RbfA [Alphaproteobacteria bacterium]MCZ6607811.1 30S ribosome-binding factor RbfA [Alphaproteobacteria bacterium]
MDRRAERGPSQRQLRVGEELRHALAWILERGEVRDPDLKGVSVTVTEVRVSPDLRKATVFVFPLGGGETEAVVTGLTRARPFLRRKVANAVRLKFVPDITFRADTSFDEARRIDILLRDPAVARDLGEDRAEDEETHGA